MKLLSCVAVLVGSLLATQNAQAIDLWRNQKRYDIDIPPPSGIPFARQGVDRLFTIAGLGNLPDISGTLRLIQDEMTECGTLIEGRKRNYLRQVNSSLRLTRRAEHAANSSVSRTLPVLRSTIGHASAGIVRKGLVANRMLLATLGTRELAPLGTRLDLQEDAAPSRTGHDPAGMAIVRHFAINRPEAIRTSAASCSDETKPAETLNITELSQREC
ncbi:hypothetical protein [Rhizobium sp. YS-1r]|uniref:hypothetical protein n=1 Tax=Rhizobium sp. YS-1r TaxID=1532558 RepID=UPI00050F0561|nr:hypothetical protein [Rhizobium sp. YS-1r]KGE01893.1 hypothetical protein JL39_03845 [Rhizobium sp. YS-1r]